GGHDPGGHGGRELLEHRVLVCVVEVGEPDQAARGGGKQQRAQGRVQRRVGDVEQAGRGGRLAEGGEGVELGREAAEVGLDVDHGWYSVRSRFKASWTFRLAASSLVPITEAISS